MPWLVKDSSTMEVLALRSVIEVNPYDVQSRCSICNSLVPDIVFDEHKETCWANTDKKKRIMTPMERRKSKFPKTNYWGTVPKK